MAGAYTAFAADGAAIWFNPAGLPLLEPRLLQGSLSLIQRRTLKISGAVVTDGPDGPGGEDQVEDFNLKSNPNLPGFAVASFALGKRKEELDNRKPVQIAISAFVLYNVSLGGDINFQDEFGRTNSLQFYQDDRASYFAAAIGHRPTRNFSWGITLLARNRVIEHVETASLAVGGTQDPSLGQPLSDEPDHPVLRVRCDPDQPQHGVQDELLGPDPSDRSSEPHWQAMARRDHVSTSRASTWAASPT